MKKGFTLIELMIVIAIIGVLAAVAVPNLNYTRKKARLSACVSNLKMISTSIYLYAADHSEAFPPADTGEDIVLLLCTSGYLAPSPETLLCTVSKAKYQYTLPDEELFIVHCPTPTEHYIKPKETLPENGLIYRSDRGVVMGGEEE